MGSKKIQDANIANPYTSSKMQIVPGQDVDLRLPRRASEEDDLLLEDATNNFFPEPIVSTNGVIMGDLYKMAL